MVKLKTLIRTIVKNRNIELLHKNTNQHILTGMLNVIPFSFLRNIHLVGLVSQPEVAQCCGIINSYCE